MRAIIERIKSYLRTHKGLIGKFAFELLIVFIGTTAAFALENQRRQDEEVTYRLSVIAAVRPTLDDVGKHGVEIDKVITAKLEAFDAAFARGERPELPVYIEPGAERPPTRIWDGIVATGAVKAIDTKTLWKLARFYNGLDSVGERYVRYAAATEAHVYGLSAGHAEAYEKNGQLKPEFKAYVMMLRDIQRVNRETNNNAASLRDDLAKIH